MQKINLLLMGLFLFVFLSYFVSATPNGATLNPGASSHAPTDSPTSNNAIAGNVTELTISGDSTTQAWQGYFGNVTGAIKLADSSDNVMYNWSLTSPEGEVYASTSNSITWASIACMGDPSSLESSFNIASDDEDGVDETFHLQNHAGFYTGNVHFAAGTCNNTKVYDNTGTGVFDEVLLTDGTNAVFASLLQDDATGFDSKTHDFEMLVLEDGHNTDTSVTPYYFWVELE